MVARRCPPYRRARYGPRTNWRHIDDTKEHNRQVSQIRRSKNKYDRRYGRHRYLIMGRELDGRPSPGAPRNREEILAQTCADWYRHADHYEWHSWRANAISLGECRELWCIDHLLDFLTEAERTAVEAVPTV